MNRRFSASAESGRRLKTIMKCHECAGTLDASDLNGDGEFSVVYIDGAPRRNGNGLGMAGSALPPPEPVSWIVLGLTSLLGYWATVSWWDHADQM